MSFEKLNVILISMVIKHIEQCSIEKHFHQVAYSTYGQCLTMICFNCELIVTNYLEKEEIGRAHV